MEKVLTNDNLYEKINELLKMSEKVDEVTKKHDALNKEVKQKIIPEYFSLYKENGEYMSEVEFTVKNSFDEEVRFLFQAKDQYIKIDAKKADVLKETYGDDIISTEISYTIPPDMVSKYGTIISDLVYECDMIPTMDKGKVFETEEKISVKKGVIKELGNYTDDYLKITEDIKPIFTLKKAKSINS